MLSFYNQQTHCIDPEYLVNAGVDRRFLSRVSYLIMPPDITEEQIIQGLIKTGNRWRAKRSSGLQIRARLKILTRIISFNQHKY
jgi:hypothetical protein